MREHALRHAHAHEGEHACAHMRAHQHLQAQVSTHMLVRTHHAYIDRTDPMREAAGPRESTPDTARRQRTTADTKSKTRKEIIQRKALATHFPQPASTATTSPLDPWKPVAPPALQVRPRARAWSTGRCHRIPKHALRQDREARPNCHGRAGGHALGYIVLSFMPSQKTDSFLRSPSHMPTSALLSGTMGCLPTTCLCSANPSETEAP